MLKCIAEQKTKDLFCYLGAKTTIHAKHALPGHVNAAYRSWDFLLWQAASQIGRSEDEKSQISGSHLAK